MHDNEMQETKNATSSNMGTLSAFIAHPIDHVISEQHLKSIFNFTGILDNQQRVEARTSMSFCHNLFFTFI